MRFQSLNEAIQSVLNPQPELTQNEYIALLEFALEAIAEELECDVEDLLEDIQTPEREQEMSGKRKKLEKRFETSAMLPKDSLGIWAHGKKDAAEKKSKQMYGKGGKVVKKTRNIK